MQVLLKSGQQSSSGGDAQTSSQKQPLKHKGFSPGQHVGECSEHFPEEHKCKVTWKSGQSFISIVNNDFPSG